MSFDIYIFLSFEVLPQYGKFLRQYFGFVLLNKIAMYNETLTKRIITAIVNFEELYVLFEDDWDDDDAY